MIHYCSPLNFEDSGRLMGISVIKMKYTLRKQFFLGGRFRTPGTRRYKSKSINKGFWMRFFFCHVHAYTYNEGGLLRPAASTITGRYRLNTCFFDIRRRQIVHKHRARKFSAAPESTNLRRFL